LPTSKRESKVLRVLRECTAYELAEHYLANIEKFCSVLLKALDCGTLAAKIFILMYQHRREWTCTELARMIGSHRQNVHRALKKLCRRGFVDRVSRSKWRLTSRI